MMRSTGEVSLLSSSSSSSSPSLHRSLYPPYSPQPPTRPHHTRAPSMALVDVDLNQSDDQVAAPSTVAPGNDGWKERALLWATIAGAVLGILLGWFLSLDPPKPGSMTLVLLALPGELFLNMLKAMALPLILASIVSGITSLGDARNTGRLATLAISFYLFTTVIAATCGIAWVMLFRPGQDVAPDPNQPPITNTPKTPLESIVGILKGLFPANLFQAAAEMNIPGIVTFAVILGIALLHLGDAGKPLVRFFHSLNAAIIQIVQYIIVLVPIGILSLISAKLGESGEFWTIMEHLLFFSLTVITGLAVHLFIFLPALYYAIVRKNPYKYLWGMSQAILVAFGTASSAATLPVTITCCEKNNKVRGETVEFMVPLGATLNMNGTALYESVAAVFIAQVVGMELDLGKVIIITLTATLAAIGAAGIPQAGLVTLLMVLTAVGLPTDMVGLIYGIDWFLDRFRTVTNVMGDAFGAAIVDHWVSRQDSEDVIAHHAGENMGLLSEGHGYGEGKSTSYT